MVMDSYYKFTVNSKQHSSQTASSRWGSKHQPKVQLTFLNLCCLMLATALLTGNLELLFNVTGFR